MKIKAVQEICNSTEEHTKLLLLCHQLKSHSDSKQPHTSSEGKPAQGKEWKKQNKTKKTLPFLLSKVI